VDGTIPIDRAQQSVSAALYLVVGALSLDVAAVVWRRRDAPPLRRRRGAGATSRLNRLRSRGSLPLAWYLVSPAGAQAAVGRFDGWLRANSRALAAALAGGIGAYLIVRGVVQSLG
jgi:hypothetical protein